MSKFSTFALVFGLFVVLMPGDATAQLAGRHVGGADFAPVDATALGDTRPASIAVFTNADAIGVGAGWGLAGGAMRGYLGANGYHVAVGGGYARTLAERRLARGFVGTFGGELVGGYNHVFERRPDDSGALRLTMPLGLSLGDPSGTSLGLYAAPYAEAGVLRRLEVSPTGCNPYCRYVLGGPTLRSAVGAGIGMRGAFRRVGAEVIFRDMSPKGRGVAPLSDVMLGFTYRLGGAELR